MSTHPSTPAADGAQHGARLREAMLRNWRDEVEGALTYRALAAHERDERRRGILLRLAEAEERHAALWEQHLHEIGVEPPDRASVQSKVEAEQRHLSHEAWLKRLVSDETQDAGKYRELLGLLPAGAMRSSVEAMVRDEMGHAESLATLVAHRHDPRTALDLLLRREHWHVAGAHGWIGDAIYGANDGLGAIFGLVTGVSGYTGGGSHLVVVSGLAGMFASALSMGSGAYLAAKAQAEVHTADIERERRELAEAPEEEREELALFYQLKGLSEQESHELVARLERDPDAMLRTMVQEELGLSADSDPNPAGSAVSSALATAVGALVPVIPFFFLQGLPALLTAAAVSLVAHFAVGALKTVVTGRNWVSSGLEMTVVGAIEGAITYGLGTMLARV